MTAATDEDGKAADMFDALGNTSKVRVDRPQHASAREVERLVGPDRPAVQQQREHCGWENRHGKAIYRTR